MYAAGLILIALGAGIILYRQGFDSGVEKERFVMKDNMYKIIREKDRFYKVQEIPADKVEYKESAWGGAYFEKKVDHD